jgi:hypothetical protein
MTMGGSISSLFPAFLTPSLIDPPPQSVFPRISTQHSPAISQFRLLRWIALINAHNITWAISTLAFRFFELVQVQKAQKSDYL